MEKYSQYHSLLQAELCKFDGGIELNSDFSDQALDDELSIEEAVSSYFSDGDFFDTDTLTEIGMKKSELQGERKAPQQPFVCISDTDAEKLSTESLYKSNTGHVLVMLKKGENYFMAKLDPLVSQLVLQAAV